MKISNVLTEDLKSIISDKNIPFEQLRGSSVLITGATGLIGTVIVLALSELNKNGFNIKTRALGRNVTKGAELEQLDGVTFIRQDVCDKVTIDGEVDYIIHAAADTKSKNMAEKPIEVITTMLEGTRNILEFASEKNIKSLVYLSSMEVYGQIDGEVREDTLGYIDLLKPRCCYPESKRMCEVLVNCYAAQRRTPAKSVRLAMTFGGGSALREDNRVSMQFARSVIDGTDIVLHTDGSSRTNCVYTADAVRAILLILLKGENGQAYNASNKETAVTIREMADIVANDVADGKIKVVVQSDNTGKYGYAPKTGYVLNTDKLEALGWTASYGLADMYKRVIGELFAVLKI